MAAWPWNNSFHRLGWGIKIAGDNTGKGGDHS